MGISNPKDIIFFSDFFPQFVSISPHLDLSLTILTLIHALKRTGGKKGVAALCLGGGDATAVAIEIL